MKELLITLGMCLAISILASGLITWIITRSADIQHNGLKGVAEQVWYGDGSPTLHATPMPEGTP